MELTQVPEEPDEMLPEYDFSKLKGGVRGKYYAQYHAKPPFVKLEPDVAAAFPDDAAVNAALRMLMELARRQVPTPPA